MSITHSLKFESHRTPQAVLNALLSSGIGLQPGQYDEMKTKGNGLYGRTNDIEKFSKKSLLNGFGVNTNVSVIFDEDSDGDREEGLEVLGKAVTQLLKEETGDAIFFWVVDTPILKRVGGKMTVINESDFEWLTNALDQANLSYESKAEELVRAA